MSSRVKRKKWCVFPNCDHAALKGTFQFPSKLEEDRRSKWLVECKLTEANVTQDSRICTRHFRPSDIQKSNNRVYLKPGSIPTFYTADEYFESVENEVIHEEILDHSHLQPKQNVSVLSLTNSSPKKSDLIIDNDHSCLLPWLHRIHHLLDHGLTSILIKMIIKIIILIEMIMDNGHSCIMQILKVIRMRRIGRAQRVQRGSRTSDG